MTLIVSCRRGCDIKQYPLLSIIGLLLFVNSFPLYTERCRDKIKVEIVKYLVTDIKNYLPMLHSDLEKYHTIQALSLVL